MIPLGHVKIKGSLVTEPEWPIPSLSVNHVKKQIESSTYQLSLCEVFLPPKVLVHGREHREPIVGVHENVDKTVQGWSKEA